MTLNYYTRARVQRCVPIYIRLCSGRKIDLWIKTGFYVNSERWSNKKQTIKQRIQITDSDIKFIKNLRGLKDYVETAFTNHVGSISKPWLKKVIKNYHSKRPAFTKAKNSFIVAVTPLNCPW